MLDRLSLLISWAVENFKLEIRRKRIEGGCIPGREQGQQSEKHVAYLRNDFSNESNPL